MLKKKTLILASLGFCLLSTLFIGITISQIGPLQSTTPEKGYVSVPAVAFERSFASVEEPWLYPSGIRAYRKSGADSTFYAAVNFPDGVTVTKLTFYYHDEILLESVKCRLCYYRAGFPGTTMAYAKSPESLVNFPYDGYSYDASINNPLIDNTQYVYYLQVNIDANPNPSEMVFRYAIIEFEYPTEPMTLETMYPDASTWIEQAHIPGTRINLNVLTNIAIDTADTTFIWHGFVSDDLWEDMTPAQQTEFLTTTEFRFIDEGTQKTPQPHVTS